MNPIEVITEDRTILIDPKFIACFRIRADGFGELFLTNPLGGNIERLEMHQQVCPFFLEQYREYVKESNK